MFHWSKSPFYDVQDYHESCCLLWVSWQSAPSLDGSKISTLMCRCCWNRKREKRHNKSDSFTGKLLRINVWNENKIKTTAAQQHMNRSQNCWIQFQIILALTMSLNNWSEISPSNVLTVHNEAAVLNFITTSDMLCKAASECMNVPIERWKMFRSLHMTKQKRKQPNLLKFWIFQCA